MSEIHSSAIEGRATLMTSPALRRIPHIAARRLYAEGANPERRALRRRETLVDAEVTDESSRGAVEVNEDDEDEEEDDDEVDSSEDIID